MGKYIYGAVIRESDEGGFWAEVPDLPGCFGQGDTLMEAVESISNGMETHLAALAEYHMPIPKASAVSTDDGQVVDGFSLGVPSVPAAEAARMLGVTPGRVSQLIKAGKLIAERSASGTLVTEESVRAYMDTPRTAGRPSRAMEA